MWRVTVNVSAGHKPHCSNPPAAPKFITSPYHGWSLHWTWTLHMPSGKRGCQGATLHVNKGVVRISVHYSLVTPVATEDYPATHLYVPPPLKQLTKGGNIWRSHITSAEDPSCATVSAFVYCILTKCPFHHISKVDKTDHHEICGLLCPPRVCIELYGPLTRNPPLQKQQAHRGRM